MKVRQMMKRRQLVIRMNKVCREYEEWKTDFWAGWVKWAEEMKAVLDAVFEKQSKKPEMERGHES